MRNRCNCPEIESVLIEDISYPIVDRDFVIKHDCSYSSTSEDGKYDFYWLGNFRTGFEVVIPKEDK